jgi:biopolymer transport protein TolR
VTTSPAKLRALRALRHAEAEIPARELKADINVTPLVDVVLVLLIIFMVVTPLIASGVAVDLPRTANHSRKPDEGKDVIVSVTSDKRIYMGSTSIATPRQLAEQVIGEKRRFPEKTIFLKADARVPYGTVREVMEALHAADVEDIILGTEELQGKH